VSYARSNDVDLIVIGTHGRGGLSHLLKGSVAERVVRKAPCMVLTGHEPMAKVA
jgi:nucleotide-binding universal stress UspA family protein